MDQLSKLARIYHDFTEAARAIRKRQVPTGTTDWFYRKLVPKKFRSNLQYRRILLELIYDRPQFIDDIQCICSRDILFEINTFGWIHNPIDFPDWPKQPFITRPYQDELILRVRDAIINRKPIGILKSREMGATWCCLVAMEHRWRYKPLQTFILSSLGEDYTNSKDGMKGLLQKVEWYTQQLPMFLRPHSDFGECKAVSSTGKYLNLQNHSSFSAEAQTNSLGTSDRATAIFLDEAAKMSKAREIFTSTFSTAYCRIFVSTPYGMQPGSIGEPFHRQITAIEDPFIMHWTDDKRKRKGLYYIDSKGKKQRFRKGWTWRESYDFDMWTFREPKPRSDWYDEQCQNAAGDDEAIAQELDLNFNKVGRSFVPEHKIAAWRREFAKPPLHWGRLYVHPDTLEHRWEEDRDVPPEDADFVLWCELEKFGQMDRPPKSIYGVGGDVATGSEGEFASPSTLVVIDEIKQRVVARFAKRGMQPPVFARFAVAVCRWFWDAILGHETNGPGTIFTKTLVDEQLYWNYYRSRRMAAGYEVEMDSIGYHSKEGPGPLLSNLRDGIERGRLVIPDEKVFIELGAYHFTQNGRIAHPRSKTTDYDGNDGVSHGDIAVACGIAYEVIQKPKTEREKEVIRPFQRDPALIYTIDLLNMETAQQLMANSRKVDEMFSGWRR